MKKTFLFAFLFLCLGLSAKNTRHVTSADSTRVRISQMMSRYQDSLRVLAQRYDSLSDEVTATRPDAYFFPLMTDGTLYDGPVNQYLMLKQANRDDEELARVHDVRNALVHIYIHYPHLVTATQRQLAEAGLLRNELQAPITHETRLAEAAPVVDIGPAVDENIVVVARRPNFWKVTGSTSLQFTQSYFSQNWFQGGENNYSALGLVTLNANYDNKQKIQWENKLEMQLGFQTAKSDTCHTFKPTSNLLRFTSKLGYKAAKHWFYTGQVQAQTQFVPNYNTNTNTVTTDFLSPLNVTVSVGMDYKWDKPKFKGSLYLSPVAYNLKYVDRLELAKRYGIEEGHHSYNSFGPNATLNYTWIIAKNVNWTGRIYWFSDFSYTNIEWENTFNFTINKFLTAKFFAYPKFNDSSKNYRNEHGTYWMFKEWLSLGVSYSF